MDKNGLRRQLTKRREALGVDGVKLKSRMITEKLLAEVDWPQVKSVHIYRSVAKWREVDTGPLIDALRQKRPKIHLDIAPLEKNQPLPADSFDLIIVPILGFDKANRRLGLGGGWYDRFLVTQPQAKKIGLAYQNSFVTRGLPQEPHDVKLDMIITEEKLWR